ncbi:MAG: hypothetical protein ACRD5H_15610, partial [Nitrososphaerales archaeon]
DQGSGYVPVTPPIPSAEASITPHPDDIYWSDGFGLTGTEGGWLNQVVKYDEKLFVGGHFNMIGSVFCRNIAALNTNGWEKVGNGIFGDVEVLRVFENKLYV